MKKIFVCILTLILSFSFIIPVNAKEITFEEVANIFVDFLHTGFEKDEEYEELKDQIKLGHTENTIYISIPVTELDMTYACHAYSVHWAGHRATYANYSD